MPELQHISRIEIHKSEREGGNRTPYQKRAPPMVKVGAAKGSEKGKSAPPEGQCKKTKSFAWK